MTVLGNMLVALALLLAGAAAVNYFLDAARGTRKGTLSSWLTAGSAASLVVASAILLALLLLHDFTNGYVYSYSDRSLPLHYLISTFYAGQEGSFLFWALCSSLISLILMRSARTRKTEPWVMCTFMAVQTMLLLLVLVKSPFRSFWEMFPDAPAGFIPADGHGLNPLLQNFWMVIHPPVLFVGFALMAVPFSLAIGGLWRREYSILTSQAFPWVLASTGILGLGIMLGAYWAYGVLGWGGYWGWDPVENSSLIPWITGMALIHTLLAQLRTGKYVRLNFILAIVSFFLVIYSTFLTRSGILGDASVHAFTDPGAVVYWLLLTFLALLAGAGIVLMIKRRNDLKPESTDTMLLTRETALGAGAVALLLSAAVTIFGTSLPIFSTTRVEPSFYDTTNLPIAIAMVVLIGFSLYTQWEMQDARGLLRRSLVMLIASAAVVGVLLILGVRGFSSLLLIGGSVFALLVNIEVGIKVARGNPMFLGGKFAHIGIALFFLGVISTGRFGSSAHLVLPLNAPRQALGHTMTYVGSTMTPDNKYRFDVKVEGKEGTYTLSPVMFDAGQQGVMRNPDIASFLTRDLYLSPVSIEERSGEGHGAGESRTMAKGETVSLGEVTLTFTAFEMGGTGSHSMTSGDGALRVGAILRVADKSRTETVTPTAAYQSGQAPAYESAHSELLNSDIRLTAMNVGTGNSPSTVTVEVQSVGEAAPRQEALVVDASTKPYINLLWGGTIVMLAGFGLSIFKRMREG